MHFFNLNANPLRGFFGPAGCWIITERAVSPQICHRPSQAAMMLGPLGISKPALCVCGGPVVTLCAYMCCTP